MPNRLAQSASPYLLQHADNPVDWWEWGDEAFAEARRRDVPVLLSVGYAACHWCHVMAHESFEDEPTAAVMNARFVNIKVDREERPDIDRIYMEATQAMTGRGGWPMTVFLTPAAAPFFAGTYFPKDEHHGMPSFTTILDAIGSAWQDRRGDVESQAAQLSAAVDHKLPRADAATDTAILEAAYRTLVGEHDADFGGFGGAPKFPQGPALEFLLRIAAEPWAPRAAGILEHALLSMAGGGIYDQVGGGFARYSVDRQWLVPHFEKMLYDNAVLARLYLRAWQVTGNERLLTVARETIDYILRDFALPGGGLASSEDADSEGAEGTFYVWSHDEFEAVVGSDAAIAAARFGVTTAGNFEGANVLYLAMSAAEVAERHGVEPEAVGEAVARARRALFDARLGRTRPDRDDKAVTAWNGLALRAIAEAALVLADPDYLVAAQNLAGFLTKEMKRADGRWLRARRQGVGRVTGFCDDYAAVILGLVAIHQADGAPGWLIEAITTAAEMVRLFAAPEGGFHAVGTDADDLIARPLDIMDNPIPSGNSLAAEALLTVGHLTGDFQLVDRTDGAIAAGSGLFERHPSAVGHLLAVAHSRNGDPRELAIVGSPDDPATVALVAAAASEFRPDVFVARADGVEAPAAIFEGRLPASEPVAYLCRRFTCEAPTSDPDALTARLGRTMPHS